jgi:hypothetical protein
VPGLPHHRLAAVLADVVHQDLGGLDVEHDGGARMPGEEVAREEGENEVGLVAPSLFVDQADAVGVAVVGDPHVGSRLAHQSHEVADVLLHLGIGQVVGKAPVRLAVQLDHLAAEATQQRGREAPRDAVTRVDDNPEGAGEPDLPGDGGEVVRPGISGGPAPAARREVGGLNAGEQALDLVLGQRRRARMDHLHAVVGDGVVAPGDGGAAVELPVGGGEVHERGVVDADVHDVDAGGEHARREGLLERRRGQA